ncbi:MAG: sulfatase [Alphaproteobacteria bacterium]|nr:sulfatase [Alphaproteobacteria bacterium]
MNLFRNVIQGAAGALVGASTLGLVEAVYLLASQGAPDLLSPAYAWVLYGLIGLPLGIGAGLVLTVFNRWFSFEERRAEAISFSFGSVGAVAPMLLFILMYLANKVVYAEAGVPTTGKLAILGLVGVYAVLELTAGVWLMRGPLKFLLKGPGVLGVWLVVAFALYGVSFVPTGADPRTGWAHGKPVPAALANKPNVLVIAVDTLRADHLGTYGRAGDPTPVIDAYAADSIVFEDNFAAASWTRSSFAAIWSSRIPSSHNTDKKASMMPDDLVLLSEVLQDAGVTTANLANNINVSSTFNFDQGYDTFLYESPAYPFGATESVFSLTFYKVVHKVHERMGGAKEVATFYQPAEVVLGDAKGFIDANRDSRWFLGVHLMEPHDPYFEHPYLMGKGDAEFNGVGFARAEVESPDPSQADYLQQVYTDEIRHMDRKLADFFDWLKAQGLYDNLMIVMTADHGEEFAEHGGFWHGTTLYDEQIHVPLIVKMPGNLFAGTRVDWQSRNIDIAPTIAAALGLEPGEGWQGSDLLADVFEADRQARVDAQRLDAAKALLADTKPAVDAGEADEDTQVAVREAEAVVAELEAPAGACDPYAPKGRVVVSEEDFEGNVVNAIRKGGLKLIEANEGNPRGLPTTALFDVVTDGGEQKNLAGTDYDPCADDASGPPEADLSQELLDITSGAKAQAVEGGDVQLDCAEIVKLCALGYMSGPDCEACQ